MDTEGAPIGDPTIPDTTLKPADPILTEPEKTEEEPIIDTSAEAEEPEPAATDVEDSSDTGTTSTEDEATKEAREKKEAQEKKEALDREVNQLGETLENTTAQTFIDQLNEPGADQDQLMSENQGKQLLRTRFLVKTTKELGKGKELRLTSDLTGTSARYRTADGKAILLVKAIDSTTDSMTCTVMGPSGPEEKSMPRTELLDLMMKTDETEILTAFTPREQELMRKYFATKRDEEKGDDYYDTLPTLITEVAEAHDIPTTGRLARTLKRHYAREPIPTGASPEESARITADNVQKAERIAKIETQLEGNNLASPEQLKMTMDLLGITPKNLTIMLEGARTHSAQLRKAIENEKDAGKKAEYKNQLDTIDATTQIYQEIQGMLAADPDGKYAEKFLESQRKGTVSAELAKSIAESLDKGEMETLIHMVSPEASITATAEEKKRFREAREKQTKILRGVGIAAALAALLLALGISQGAKQQ